MDLVPPAAAPPHDPDHVVAVPVVEGTHCSVRVIRLSAGQALPPHAHGTSELVLYVAEGEARLDTDDGTETLTPGWLARLDGNEELRVANRGTAPVTLLAFLAPPFPPR
jgi:quercetin dioxygenase-like cupin family protein